MHTTLSIVADAQPRSDVAAGRPVDAAGFPVFSDGARGRAHLIVHRLLDRGDVAGAGRVLEPWLRDADGDDDDDVHLHWHMLVIDATLGRFERAYRRFVERVLPRVPTGGARTDGPAGLWHLALAAGPADAPLPWAAVDAVARAHLTEPDPLLAAHDALALAGAGSLHELDRWIAHRRRGDGALSRIGRGLRARARGDHAAATRHLRAALPALEEIGGSLAQRALFERIAAAGPTGLRLAA